MSSGDKRSRDAERSRSNSQEDKSIPRMDDRDRRGPHRRPERRTTQDPDPQSSSQNAYVHKYHNSQLRSEPYQSTQQYCETPIDPRFPPSKVFDSFSQSEHPLITSDPFATPLFGGQRYVLTPPGSLPGSLMGLNSTSPPISFENVSEHPINVSNLSAPDKVSGKGPVVASDDSPSRVTSLMGDFDDSDGEVLEDRENPSYDSPLFSHSPPAAPGLVAEDPETRIISKADDGAKLPLKKKKQNKGEKKTQKFTCRTCGRTFERKVSLVQHQIAHSTEQPYRCECGGKFKRKEDLTRHRQNHCKLVERPEPPNQASDQRSLRAKPRKKTQ